MTRLAQTSMWKGHLVETSGLSSARYLRPECGQNAQAKAIPSFVDLRPPGT
jgi:hypothetical protein